MHFILVHGICHGGWCWEETRKGLEYLGHTVSTPNLPLTSLIDDAKYVQALLDDIDGPSILVGHSYGGMVISVAAHTRTDVSHLVYAAAFLIDDNEDFLELASSYPNYLRDYMVPVDDTSFTISDEGAYACFYNSCHPEVAARAVSKLRPTANACLAPYRIDTPWKTVNSTYILCNKDKAIVPELQQFMSQKAEQTYTLDADHSPFYSSQNELLEILSGVIDN